MLVENWIITTLKACVHEEPVESHFTKRGVQEISSSRVPCLILLYEISSLPKHFDSWPCDGDAQVQKVAGYVPIFSLVSGMLVLFATCD